MEVKQRVTIGGSGEYNPETVKHGSGKPVRYIDFIDPEGHGVGRAALAEDVESLPPNGETADVHLQFRYENSRCKVKLLGWESTAKRSAA